MQLLGGRYRLVEPVGEGGMAVVWRAEDELLHRTVAVKLLASRLARDPHSRQRIRAEAYAAAQLSHPHIANVYDYGEARSRGYRRIPYLVLEYVPGETLAARLRSGGALDWPEAVRVAADVADALGAAHAAELVHRDVKPGNVLLSPAGVKLVDLGIAVAVGERPLGERGEVLGTPRYMAPEQVGGGPATPASDVYALGLLLHECLTGEPLRKGSTVAELLAPDQFTSIPPEPDVPGLPESVERLRRWCLAPEPADRPTSAEAAAVLAEAAPARPLRRPTPALRPATLTRPTAHPGSPATDPADPADDPADGREPVDQTSPATTASPATLTSPATTVSPTVLAGPAAATRSTAPPGRPGRTTPGQTTPGKATPGRAGRPDATARPPRLRRALRRSLLLAVAPATALAAVLTAQLPGLTSADDAAEGAGAGESSAASDCIARYTTRRAPDGTFTADLAVSHTGAQAPASWVLSFALPPGQRLTDSSAAVRLGPGTDTVTIDLGGDEPPDGTATVSLRGTYEAAGEGMASNFALNGLRCREASTSITSMTLTTPGPGDRETDRNPSGGRGGDATGGSSDAPASEDPTGSDDPTGNPDGSLSPTPDASDTAPTPSTPPATPSPTGSPAGTPSPSAGSGDGPSAEPSRSERPDDGPTDGEGTSPTRAASPTADGDGTTTPA